MIAVAHRAEVTEADLPADVTTPLPAKFRQLGYTAEDGVELEASISTEPVNVHQSAVPVKYVIDSAAAKVKLTLMQFDRETVELYFGSEWESTGALHKLTIASTPLLAEKTLVLEWGDAVVRSRFVCERGMVSEREAIKIARKEAQALPLTFDALDNGKGALGYILTNAPLDAPGAASAARAGRKAA